MKNIIGLALALVVVEDHHAVGANLEANRGVLADRQLLLRIAAVVAVRGGAVTDVQAQVARVEPDGRDTLTVVAAVAAVSGDVDDVAPATDSTGRVIHFRYGKDTSLPETILAPAASQVSSAGNILLRWSGRSLWDRFPSRDIRHQWRLTKNSLPSGSRL